MNIATEVTRRALCAATLCVVAMGAGLGMAAAQGAAEPIVLRIADTDVPGTPEHEASLWFNSEVERRSDGRIKIEYFANSQLGTDKQFIPALLSGSLDVGKISSGNFADLSDALLFTELPGLFTGMEHMRAVWQSDIRDEIGDTIIADTTLTPIQFDIDGGAARALGYQGEPITAPGERDLKIRTTGSPVEIALFEAWGIAPTPITWAELYTSIQQGVVDGLYGHPPGTYSTGMVDVIDGVTILDISFITSIRAMSAEAVRKLGGPDSELMQLVLEVGSEAELMKDRLNAEKLTEVKQKFLDAGKFYVELTDEQLEPWRTKAQSIWEEVADDIDPDLIARVQAIGADM